MPILYGWDYGDTDPLRCPSFRASASGTAWKAAFADGVPPGIIAFHRYTGSSTFLHRPLASRYHPRCPRFLSPMDLTGDGRSRLRALYAQLYRITLAPRVSPRLLARGSPALPTGYRHPLETRNSARPYEPGWNLLKCRTQFPVVSSLLGLLPRRTGVYDALRKAPSSSDAASRRQAFAHCDRFRPARPIGGLHLRRDPALVSVPVGLSGLSPQLPVAGLVGRYPTNYLMGRGPIPKRTPCEAPFLRAHVRAEVIRH